MSGPIGDVLNGVADRHPSPLVCVVLYAALVSVLVAWAGFSLGRFGPPSRWPARSSSGFALVAGVLGGRATGRALGLATTGAGDQVR
jgi:hypothetical protein